MADDPIDPPNVADIEQPSLLGEDELPPDWKKEWRGLPDYTHSDLMPQRTMLVHFRNDADCQAFSKLVGQTFHARTKFIWFPKAEIRTAADKVYTRTTKVTPRYPVYIISKGRWESRLTSKSLEWIGVPYHIVIEPQEYDNYAAVIDPAKILTLPFSNLGLGGIPARNWVWEHAITTGAARHWILDDNISGFCRFQDNLKVELDSGATFCAVEDFVDRYENIAMAGFNYDYFAPRKQGSRIRPITWNTRIYSGILLRNDLTDVDGNPIRWRGRYNEDTDLSIRILKDGMGPAGEPPGRYATALFNAFLMYKKPTLTMKGGNTDELYQGVNATAAEWAAHAKECKAGCKVDIGPTCQAGRDILSKDGRWLMAESLRAQHPDIVIVDRKWDRWQHLVDYRRFERNPRVLRPDAVIPDGDPYELTLGDMDTTGPSQFDEQEPTADDVPKASQRPAPRKVDVAPIPASTVSALDFTEPEVPDRTVRFEPMAVAVDAPIVAQVEVQPAPLPTSPPEPQRLPDAAAVKADLAAKGHTLLTRDGGLFITGSSRLSAEDRAIIKSIKPALMLLAEPWPVAPIQPTTEASQPSFGEQAQPTSSVVQFLGHERQQVKSFFDWRPDQPPSLDGIKEVVLNFATNGLDWAGGDRPCGVTVSTLDGQMTRFLPFGFVEGGNLDEAVVKEWARRELRNKKITNANTRFDMHHSRRWGVDLEEQGCTFSDIQHTAALLDDHRKRFRLDFLCEDYLPDLKIVPRVDETRHHQHHASEVAAREVFTAQLVGKLIGVMYPELEKQELMPVQQLEDRVIPAVVEMEENGAPIDVELLEQYGAECSKRHDSLLWEIAREVGFAFDHKPTSWQKLFEHLHLPPTDSVAENVIGAIDHPTVKKAHLAAQLASLSSKIFNAYPKWITDGILRFEINQLRNEEKGTVTGRFSASPIQQVPNHDNHAAVFGEDLFPRRLYIPGAGHKYLAADAAQIQYRIFAHYANNPKIMAMYAKNPQASFHRMIEGLLRPYKPDLVYSHVKNMNFMRIFGGGLVKLAVMMGYITEAEGEEIQHKKAQRSDERLTKAREIESIYAREMPEVDPLLKRAMHLAMTKCNDYCANGINQYNGRIKPKDELHRLYPHRGYVKTILGRRSRFPDDYRLHKAFCMIDQGSEGDIVKTKIAELHEARKQTGFLMRMTVHDEVTGDALADDTLSKVDTILNRQSFPQLKVPILWECKEGRNWAEAK